MLHADLLAVSDAMENETTGHRRPTKQGNRSFGYVDGVYRLLGQQSWPLTATRHFRKAIHNLRPIALW